MIPNQQKKRVTDQRGITQHQDSVAMSQETPCGCQRASRNEKSKEDIQQGGVGSGAPARHNIDRNEQNWQDNIGNEEGNAKPAKEGKNLRGCSGAKYKPKK